MKQYGVYLLRCADGSYYIGVTNDIARRVEEHQTGWDPKAYTHRRRPVTLVYSAEFSDVREAIAWEKKIKGWSRRKKEALIAGKWDELPALAECKNATHHRHFNSDHPASMSP